MPRARVRHVSQKGDYGFLEPNIFFHVTKFPRGVRPVVGDVVEFEQATSQKGMCAVNCRIVGGERGGDVPTMLERVFPSS